MDIAVPLFIMLLLFSMFESHRRQKLEKKLKEAQDQSEKDREKVGELEKKVDQLQIRIDMLSHRPS